MAFAATLGNWSRECVTPSKRGDCDASLFFLAFYFKFRIFILTFHFSLHKLRDMINELKGILLIDKPVGLTSNFVVTKVKKLLGAKKVGHAGTLDPFATGILVILLGNYTRLAEYFLNLPKEYIAKIELGKTTNTYDIDGEILSIKPTKHIDFTQVKNTINSFVGEIEQVPPLYSAIKIRGKRAYELARKGKELDLPPRKVNIYKIEILKFDNPYIEISVTCSAGTYIRSLANDIGKKLGCGAYVKELRRTKIDNFNIYDAMSLKEMQVLVQKKKIKQFFINPLTIFKDMDKYVVTDQKDLLLVKNGNTLKKEVDLKGEELLIVDDKNQLLAIANVEKKNEFNYIKPVKVLI